MGMGDVMRSLVVAGVLILSLVMFSSTESVNAGGKKEPKYTIKEVMREAHKSGLWKRVAQGKADQDEKKKLVELYTALSENKPPAGDLDAWKKQTGTMLDEAKKAAAGNADAAAMLLKTVNCGKCHKAFKG
jgi:hypothetical protein